MHKLALIVLLAAGTLAIAQDSPLVAAAKSRKNAKQKAKIVITNDTLSKSGGHISTTASQPPLVLPKEAPKAPEPAKPAPEAKPAAPAKEPLPQIDDAARLADGPVTEEELDLMLAPLVIPPKGTQLIEPQRTVRIVEPQRSQKPKDQ